MGRVEAAPARRYHGTMKFTVAIPVAVLGLMALSPAWADVPAEARDVFDRYQSLERSFDPQLAELYDDDAVILVTRVYANGVVRHLKIPGDVYKLALRQSMEAAAEAGDFNQYNDIEFASRDGAVEVTAQRYNLWRNYSSPYRALLRVDEDGYWRIVEERMETQVPYTASE